MITIDGKEYRELKSDEDKIQVNGHIIRWSKKQQRYTIYDPVTQRQMYDTKYFDGAIRSALQMSKRQKVKVVSSATFSIHPTIDLMELLGDLEDQDSEKNWVVKKVAKSTFRISPKISDMELLGILEDSNSEKIWIVMRKVAIDIYSAFRIFIVKTVMIVVYAFRIYLVDSCLRFQRIGLSHESFVR